MHVRQYGLGVSENREYAGLCRDQRHCLLIRQGVGGILLRADTVVASVDTSLAWHALAPLGISWRVAGYGVCNAC